MLFKPTKLNISVQIRYQVNSDERSQVESASLEVKPPLASMVIGCLTGVARKKDGKLGRNVSRLSFHSLRHSFNSAMANADVPLEIRQKLTGHASQDMNKHYTHLELETVRRAVHSISRLPGKASNTPR
jgi:integrase